MKHKLQTVSNFTVGQTSNWLESRVVHQNQTSNLCWTRNQVCLPKPNYDTKKLIRTLQKIPKLRTHKLSSTQHWYSELKMSLTGIDESEMKSDVTTQNFVGNLKNLHSCIPMKWAAPMFFFHSPTINTMYSEIRGLCFMNWPSEMLQILPFHQA